MRPFARHSERKALRSPRRIATINGRPAWEVVAERRASKSEPAASDAKASATPGSVFDADSRKGNS